METLSPETVCEAFLAAPPAISSQILDLTIKHPSFMADLPQYEEFGLGQGASLQQLVFRGSKPQVERDFSKWKKVGDLSGCNPCDVPNSTYNWTTFGGHGFDRKLLEFMTRDFRSPNYQIHEIQTTAHFEQVFGKVVENLYSSISFFKEENIVHNYLVNIAKKYIVDTDGPKPNPRNPYVYRNIGTVKLSRLNIDLLEFFYEQMVRMPEAIPYDVIDGAPVFSLMGSRQLIARMFRDDAAVRQDARFSGLATDMLLKYNFMSTARGMFILAPILYPRRFKIVAGEPVEILPFINDVPAEFGCYTDINPDYENLATHEEILLHGMYPFKILYMPTATTLGANTSFGPEQALMNTWEWVNPLTAQDPARREGFFFTSATIALAPQFSDAVFGVLVERPSITLATHYNPVKEALPVVPTVNNSVPLADCPCGIVLSVTQSLFDPLLATVVFTTPQAGAIDDDILLVLDNGLTVTGTITQITADGLTAELSFTDGLCGACPTNVVGVSCDEWRKCSATILEASDCRTGETGVVSLVLSNGLKAEVGENILAYFGDCTTALLEIVAIDSCTATYTVQYETGYGPTDDGDGNGGTNLEAGMICDRGGISKICVPPATDATCPPCTAVLAACADEV